MASDRVEQLLEVRMSNAGRQVAALEVLVHGSMRGKVCDG